MSGRVTRNLIFLFGFAFFSVGAIFTFYTFQFLENALQTTGQVVAIDTNRSDDGTTYKPTFSYVDFEGRHRRGNTLISSSGYNFNIGEKMDILYDTRDFSRVRLTGWFNTWGFGTIFMIAGMLPMAISRFVRRRQKSVLREETDSVRDKYVRLESPESEEDHRRETEYTPTVRRR